MSPLVVFCKKMLKSSIWILRYSLMFVKLENNKNNKKFFPFDVLKP
ncbi:hypothetical protein B4168_2289 [Anoxybacillus flavithermus]|nr:hypothetical protein B4168_2289 [Anoxybacillus flavithermus]